MGVYFGFRSDLRRSGLPRFPRNIRHCPVLTSSALITCCSLGPRWTSTLRRVVECCLRHSNKGSASTLCSLFVGAQSLHLRYGLLSSCLRFATVVAFRYAKLGTTHSTKSLRRQGCLCCRSGSIGFLLVDGGLTARTLLLKVTGVSRLDKYYGNLPSPAGFHRGKNCPEN